MNYFFSPEDFDNYPPVGMFTLPHILFAIFCFLMVGLLIFLSRKMSEKKLNKITKIFAFIFLFLELIKIGYNFYYKYFGINSWLPLNFCSIFIYSLFISGFAKNPLKKLGDAFLVGAGIVSGTAFLIFPTTSLMLHPLWHYLSLYSMFFHSSMLYFGLMYAIKKIFIPSIKNYKFYFAYSFSFCLIAILVNQMYKSNLMFLQAPYNLPIEIVNKLYDFSHFLYTLLILFVYVSIYFIVYFVYLIILKYKRNHYQSKRSFNKIILK